MAEIMTEDIVYRLKKRAEIRRQIPSRKSVQENKPDRIADLLEEAATEILKLRSKESPAKTTVEQLQDICGFSSPWKFIPEDRFNNIWQHLKDREPIKDSYSSSSFHCWSHQYEMHGMIYECTFENGSMTPIEIQWRPKQ